MAGFCVTEFLVKTCISRSADNRLPNDVRESEKFTCQPWAEVDMDWNQEGRVA